MTKRTLIVGNWKMHLNTHEASLLVNRLDDRIELHRDIEVVLAPSMLSFAATQPGDRPPQIPLSRPKRLFQR